MANGTGNREYRSDVFSMLLEDRSFSLTVRNDASFVLDANLSLYEHQSTLCPNMPLRDLIYFAAMIQKRVYTKRRDLYARTLLKIPTPQFVVFYNGKESAPECYELRLSDVFEKKRLTSPSWSWSAKYIISVKYPAASYKVFDSRGIRQISMRAWLFSPLLAEIKEITRSCWQSVRHCVITCIS